MRQLNDDFHATEMMERYITSCGNEFWQKSLGYELAYLVSNLHGCRDILSVGCGPAIIEGGLVKHGFNVTGLDVSREALSHAPDGVRTVEACAEDMPFLSNSFDAVIFVASLQSKFNIKSEYFLGVSDDRVLERADATCAISYILKGTSKGLLRDCARQ